MENNIIEKIKKYCESIKMNSNDLVIQNTEDGGFVARDKNVSIIFDKDGNVKSLPSYRPYGRGNYAIGKISSILFIIAIGMILLMGIFSALMR